MSGEIRLDIAILKVKPQKDGSTNREEFIVVNDMGLYHNTEGRKLQYPGDSTEFINYAGCNTCPVKESLCKPKRRQGHIGRMVRYNTADYPLSFPCQVKYDDSD